MAEHHRSSRDEGTPIRKGPWMADEDEILMDYVKKYGPRDWSAIRSKGLLPRTGKSCRLRWVNKLKPDLKTGCKFSAEEERIVINLQAEFGNKWARIATYLKGRTDNDVKNFWSTRQKRLARLLQTSPPTRGQRNHGKVPTVHEMPAFEASSVGSMQFQEETSVQSGKPFCYMGNSDVIKMVQLPDLVNQNLLNMEPDLSSLEYKSNDKKPCLDISSQLPFTQLPQPMFDFTTLPGSQDLTAGFGDTSLLDMFVGREVLEPDSWNGPQFTLGLPFSEQDAGQCGSIGEENTPTTPESFFDDFPADMFDHLEPLPSSLEL